MVIALTQSGNFYMDCKGNSSD